jgi:hypothetical protein
MDLHGSFLPKRRIAAIIRTNILSQLQMSRFNMSLHIRFQTEHFLTVFAWEEFVGFAGISAFSGRSQRFVGNVHGFVGFQERWIDEFCVTLRTSVGCVQAVLGYFMLP